MSVEDVSDVDSVVSRELDSSYGSRRGRGPALAPPGVVTSGALSASVVAAAIGWPGAATSTTTGSDGVRGGGDIGAPDGQRAVNGWLGGPAAAVGGGSKGAVDAGLWRRGASNGAVEPGRATVGGWNGAVEPGRAAGGGWKGALEPGLAVGGG
jgi:hypothetical protein